jgi:Holliday junction resolvase
MTPEAKVKAKVKKLLEELRIYYFFPATHGYGRSGVPDIIGCFMGLFVAIECKAGKGQLTGLQELELTKIKAAGGFTFVAREDNINELKEKLTCLIQELLPSA